jgi:hypothetical protein
MITRADVERLSVGLGDELFFVTLFEQLPGRSRDLPILRFGNVARMPEELVAIELADGWSVDVEAFLVEARSWGGESGAPTFLYFPMDRQAEGLGVGSILISTTEEPSSIANVKGLLGMVHGHYDIARSVKRGGLVADHVDPASQWSGTVAVNAGVAIIIPAWTIMETLDQEELMADRKKVEDEIAKTEPRPTADSAFPDDPTVTRDGFMKDLEQVSQPLDTQE